MSLLLVLLWLSIVDKVGPFSARVEFLSLVTVVTLGLLADGAAWVKAYA